MIFHPSERPKPKNLVDRQPDSTTPASVAEVKHDGWRMTLVRESGKLRALGRNLRDYWHQMPDLVRKLALDMPDNTVVDGELFVPGMHATEVPRMMKSRDPRLSFVAFALPVYDSKCHRLEALSRVRDILRYHSFEVPIQFEQASKFTVDDWRAIAVRHKIEGLVLKEAHWSGWWKVKPYLSLDGYVIGVKPGQGKHEGRVGSMEVAVRRHDQTDFVVADVGTGGDEHWRDLPLDSVMGRVVEVFYDEVGAGGRLKFPRFARWRDDKDAAECTSDQLQ